MNTSVRARLALILSVATLLAAGAVARGVPVSVPGEPELANLQHVYNYPFPDNDTDWGTGTDLEFYVPEVDGEPRDVAVVGALYDGAYLFDITDPEEPSFISHIECSQWQNDVQIKRFEDRWVLALAHDDIGGLLCLEGNRLGSRAGGGISLFDITDPRAPQSMYSIGVSGGAHNFTFHPTQPFGWVSSGALPGPRDRIRTLDFRNLEQPAYGPELMSVGGVHDIVFNAEGTRAYVASENNARIYDVTDPLAPELISVTVSPGTYVHDAFPTPDGEHMIVVNESLALGGFFVEGTTVCPGEGITIYKIGGALERAPVPVGYFLIDTLGHGPDARACTAHVGRTAPNSRYHVLGWYIGGVRVVDLVNPAAPVEVGRAVLPDTEVWAAKMHKGPYIYTGDQGRGFDVYRWTGPSFFE